MARTKPQRYDVHPGVKQMQEWIASLPAKTGRSIREWVRFIREEGPKEERAAIAWLKAEHGQGTNTAWWLAERAFAKDLAFMDDDPARYLEAAGGYVEAQYAGKKAGLRPIYDRLYALARSLGKEAKLCPCTTIVPVYRSHVIAQIKPTTNTRVDFGLALGPVMRAGKKMPGRLIDTGGYEKKDRITHRIALGSAEEVDEFVARWARRAYELDG